MLFVFSESITPIIVCKFWSLAISISSFKSNEPIGKQIRLYGQRYTVIGVLKKMGENMIGGSNDVSVFLPVNNIRKLYGDNSNLFKPIILIKPKSGIDIEEFKAELSNELRNYRGIKPNEINNFFNIIFVDFIFLKLFQSSIHFFF